MKMTISSIVGDKRPRQICCIDTPINDPQSPLYTHVDDYDGAIYPEMITLIVNSNTIYIDELTIHGKNKFKLLPK